jgi:hypothetical protein
MFMHRKYCNILIPDLEEFFKTFFISPLNPITVWETTARQLAKREWKFRVASKIHFILVGLASNSCKTSRNLKTLATITGLQL